MAKFCFISFAQPGHCDFGGMSYVRTAVALQNRGHEVQWVLSPHPQAQLNVRAQKIIRDSGLHFKEFSGLHTRNKNVGESVKNFGNHLKSSKYDCVVVDRLCVAAAFSAHLAGIPWATAGTDGRDWMPKRLRSIFNKGVFPGSWNASPMNLIARSFHRDDFPKPSSKTMWATSPFLNISFFPKVYYQDKQGQEPPKHSHFVGCGATPEPLAQNSYLLVTFGNVFNPVVRQKLLKLLKPLIREFSINVLFLAGNRGVANSIRQSFRHNSAVEIKEWMPYDQAYREAVCVIGHGGTSHIWYGMREGKPLLAIPLKADQYFGAFQLERLNVGRNLVPLVAPWSIHNMFRKSSHNSTPKDSVYLSKRKLSTVLHELLTDTAIQDSSIRLSRLMRRGGGIQASVSLLECLAKFQEPVSNCIAPSCCC